MEPETVKITIEDLPERLLLGNWMRLNINTVAEDYPILWAAFSRRIAKIGNLADRPLYGVCANHQIGGSFDYWTAIEILPGTPNLNGMFPFPIPAGAYACLFKPQGATLIDSYASIYKSLDLLDDYALNRQSPSFELYGLSGDQKQDVKICVPLQSRASRRASLDQTQPVNLPLCRIVQEQGNRVNTITG
jgi:predicted transcriptional regulator YdeE